MKISFHGASRGVTGSCHLLEVGDVRILVDCGMYQGGRELDEENAEPFGFDAASIDYLLLTHAHLDHCGRIPLLARRGFRGEIVATAATRELARLVMLDAASLEEEEARYQSRKLARRGGQDKVVDPLFGVLDAMNGIGMFGRTAVYGKPLQLAAGLQVTFLDAGHILGSACILVEAIVAGKQRRILFSGDLGGNGRPLLRDPTPPPRADVVVMETTYGDRDHRQVAPSVDEFYHALLDTFRRGGNVIIPTFALERAQELLFYLREGVEQGRLPGAMQVFLDSPMAISATEIFRRHPDCYEPDVAALFHRGGDPFDLPGLHFTRESGESMALNRIHGGAVILAGSGMCTGGRVRHHLRHHLWRRQSSVVFVGFAAYGTLARRIVDGAKEVKIFGETIPVKAAIHTINGFSAHAGQTELLAWHKRAGADQATFLVHGEEDVMASFAKLLPGPRVIMPELHSVHAL